MVRQLLEKLTMFLGQMPAKNGQYNIGTAKLGMEIFHWKISHVVDYQHLQRRTEAGGYVNNVALRSREVSRVHSIYKSPSRESRKSKKNG